MTPKESEILLFPLDAHLLLLLDYPCNFMQGSNLSFDANLAEIRKLTANVEAVLLGVIIPLCQRNSGRLEEADREVLFDSYFFRALFHSFSPYKKNAK